VKAYLNQSNDAGILAYEYGSDWIRIRFSNGEIYEYTSARIGRANLNRMKRLAEIGDGLTTFINTHATVREGYSPRIE